MSPIPYKPVTQEEVAQGVGTALLGRLGAVVEVVAQPAYTLMYGLATYGLYTVLWSLVNLIENIADLGMTSALQRVVPQARGEGEAVAALRWALVLGVGPCLVVAAIASAAAPWLGELINVAADDRGHLVTGIALFAWALPLWAFVEIGTSALRARRAFGPEIRLRIFWEQIIRLVCATALWFAGVDTLGLLIAHLASLTITAAATTRLLSRHYALRLMLSEPLGRPMFRDTALSGVAVLPTNIIARLFSDAPPVLLNLWLPGAAGAQAAGLYGIARRLSSLVQIVRMAFSYVIGPLASAVARRDRASIQPLYAFSTRVSTAIALPIAAVIAAGGDILLRAFGKEAAGAWPLLLALTVARAFDAIGGPASTIQQVASRKAQSMYSSLIGLAAAAILAAILLPSIGAPGMALAIAAGLIVSVMASLIQLRRHDDLDPFARPFGQAAGVGLAVAALIVLLLSAAGAAPLPVRITLLLLSLLGGLWLSLRFGLTENDKDAFGMLAKRLKLRRV
jgi:O-antigen/teichoic acid export membrane protein